MLIVFTITHKITSGEKQRGMNRDSDSHMV